MSPGAISLGGAGSLPDGWRHKCRFPLAEEALILGSYPGTPGQVFLLGGPIQLEPLGVGLVPTYGD